MDDFYEFSILDELSGEKFIKGAKEEYYGPNKKRIDKYILHRINTDFKADSEREKTFIKEMVKEGFSPLSLYKLYMYLDKFAKENNARIVDYFNDQNAVEIIAEYFCKRFKPDDLIKVIEIIGKFTEIVEPEPLLDCIFSRYEPDDILRILKVLDENGYIISTIPNFFEDMHRIKILKSFFKFYLKDRDDYIAVADWIVNNKKKKIGNVLLEYIIESGTSPEFLKLIKK